MTKVTAPKKPSRWPAKSGASYDSLPDGEPWTKRDEIARLDDIASLVLTTGGATIVAGVTLGLTVPMVTAAKACAVVFSVLCGLCGIVGAMSLRHSPGDHPYAEILKAKLFARRVLLLLLGLLYVGVLATSVIAVEVRSPHRHQNAAQPLARQSKQRRASHPHP